VATGNVAQTTVCGKGVSRLSGFAQRINFTAAALDDTAFISQTNSFHASLSTGDKFVCRVTVTTESALSNLKNLSLQIRAQINGVLSTTYALCFGYSVSSVAAVGEKYEVILETPVIEAQASTTQLKSALYIVAKSAGNIVVDISKMEILKLN
jgi:adenylosuccinate lyase